MKENGREREEGIRRRRERKGNERDLGVIRWEGSERREEEERGGKKGRERKRGEGRGEGN